MSERRFIGIGTASLLIGIGYYRLSREEAEKHESASIKNQRDIVRSYCEQNGITLVREFNDDGYTGGNFDRPGFSAMLDAISSSKIDFVITKDLSRLGRNMRESSYYAEEYLPEHGVRYIAIGDNFDTDRDNVMAPFQFAMNEVYLRDGSRKVKEVLKHKREHGQYCACAPYGYRKADGDIDRLVPDDATSPIVQRIYEAAAAGDSCRRIALDLTSDGILPPLKHRVLSGGKFSEDGAARASDVWSYTTVKRIVANPVYLGHTLLGKSKKVSFKSKKKIPIPSEQWAITENTHVPLVSRDLYDRARENIGRGRKVSESQERTRNSIFGGIAVCGLCGHALCSCGTVYKGERDRYWYLSCTHQRQGLQNRCTGVRVKYSDLMELVREDLNRMISLPDEEIKKIVSSAIRAFDPDGEARAKKAEAERVEARLSTIGKMILRLYADNADGKLSNARLHEMISDLESESSTLEKKLASLAGQPEAINIEEQFQKFFELARSSTKIDVLTRDILRTFVEKIEVFPKILPPGKQVASHGVQFTQKVRIYYRFIGTLATLQKDS